jgi:hypothetical protein
MKRTGVAWRFLRRFASFREYDRVTTMDEACDLKRERRSPIRSRDAHGLPPIEKVQNFRLVIWSSCSLRKQARHSIPVTASGRLPIGRFLNESLSEFYWPASNVTAAAQTGFNFRTSSAHELRKVTALVYPAFLLPNREGPPKTPTGTN